MRSVCDPLTESLYEYHVCAVLFSLYKVFLNFKSVVPTLLVTIWRSALHVFQSGEEYDIFSLATLLEYLRNTSSYWYR